VPAEPFPDCAETAVLGHLRRAQCLFFKTPEDIAGEFAAFDGFIAEAEKIVVMRLARGTASVPPAPDMDETERNLRAIDAGQRRARREAHLTAYAIIGISIVAVVAAALRFTGVGA